MKNLATLILLLACIFVTTQLSAQEDSKTNSTPPPVQSSKTRPGSTTSDQTKNSQTKKETPPATQSGTMTSSNAAAQSKKIYDASGTLIYTLDQLGYIRNPKNRLIGQYTADGEYIRKRTVVGKVENGVIRDRYGKEYARISQDGKVVDSKNKHILTIKADGTVLNGTGTKIGSAPGVDKNVAAIVFFFQNSK